MAVATKINDPRVTRIMHRAGFYGGYKRAERQLQDEDVAWNAHKKAFHPEQVLPKWTEGKW